MCRSRIAICLVGSLMLFNSGCDSQQDQGTKAEDTIDLAQRFYAKNFGMSQAAEYCRKIAAELNEDVRRQSARKYSMFVRNLDLKVGDFRDRVVYLREYFWLAYAAFDLQACEGVDGDVCVEDFFYCVERLGEECVTFSSFVDWDSSVSRFAYEGILVDYESNVKSLSGALFSPYLIKFSKETIANLDGRIQSLNNDDVIKKISALLRRCKRRGVCEP